MYWPLGAPRIYAANPRPPDPRSSSSHGQNQADHLLALRVSRNGHLFATITSTTLTIWQTRPTAVLASVVRSAHSLDSYGPNVSLLLRPDSGIVVVQTKQGYLITYSLATDPSARVYKQKHEYGHARRHSMAGQMAAQAENESIREVSVRFRMVIKVDAGVGKALALDEELVVATEKPPAVQCIRWTPDTTGTQTSTELLSRMTWISKKTTVVDMVYDRAMSLSGWITSDGKAYAVQRLSPTPKISDSPQRLFRGYGFHDPANQDEYAMKASINARFSLIAVGCASGDVCLYSAKDYVGSIPLSHKVTPPVSRVLSGHITFLKWSPDGYCLFIGFEKGWATWSVYGKPGSSSFNSDRSVSDGNEEGWLTDIRDGSWLSGGSEMLLLGRDDDRLWVLDMARSATTSFLSSANVSRILLQTYSGLMMYRGYDLPDLTAISADSSLWQHVQIPNSYLLNQGPIRSVVISPDGRYIAVAGRRGLAHYSVNSGRWKIFDDHQAESAFALRGGMCWYQHILIAAVEAGENYELRLHSRELPLDPSSLLHVESIPAPAVLISLSGDDSLLVYTFENTLYHYMITATAEAVKLVQVGQIAFHGLIRAPARVRAISWILPHAQRQDGDPSHDVSVASVVFLVDGKLVLLQPTTADSGDLKYDMRVIAHNVEYYALMRDQLPKTMGLERNLPSSAPIQDGLDPAHSDQGLADSLWIFNGNDMHVWLDVQDVLKSAAIESARGLNSSIQVAVDFYPLSINISKGILIGLESELVQRRDVNFALFRPALRTHLFLSPLLFHHLSNYDSPAALHLAYHYKHLSYFPHALEMLLHTVLDEEVDKAPSPDNALLPTVLSFLSSFPEYLDILVQCTRKTELRSWRTLFSYLPPPQELFEQSLQKGLLKTAGGYLLVLHTFEELSSSSEQLVRLLRRAKEEQDWDLCKELARFLMALDESGTTLREALELMELKPPVESNRNGLTVSSNRPRGQRHSRPNGIGLGLNMLSEGSRSQSQASSGSRSRSPLGPGQQDGGGTSESSGDYFSMPREG